VYCTERPRLCVQVNTFLDNIDNWEKQNLFIQNIPAYSPELNKIEILWRKIKYEWACFIFRFTLLL